MRLTLLIRDLNYAGAQRQLVALAMGLPRDQNEVTVVTFYGGPLEAELQSAGINVISLGKKNRWDMLGFLWRLIAAIRASKPDVLYSFLNESNLVSALIKPLLPGTRIIWGLRDSETDAALFGWLGKLVFKLSCLLSGIPDQLIANSHAGAAYYITQGYPKDRLIVIPNGIDHERFQPDQTARTQLRVELGITDDDILFGIVGRLSPMKDYTTFLRAAATLRDNQRAKFLCIGKGNDDYTREIHALADHLGIAAKVIWQTPRNDMPRVFNALDALVSSSAFGEGFSNVVGEAMACGTPCIVTDVGDSRFLVSEAGFSLPPRDPQALGAALQRFTQLKHEDRCILSERARQRITDNFTLPKMIERTEREIRNSKLETSANPSTTDEGPRISSFEFSKPLFLITALGTGGAEMMLTQLLTNLDRTRFAPEVITLIPGGKHTDILHAAGIPVHDLGMNAGKPNLAALLKLRRLVKAISPDVLVGWMYHGNLAATLASWIGKRVPVLWNVRQSLYNLAFEKRGSAFVIKSLARLGFNPKHIFYNSKISAQQHEAIGYPIAKTILIPNGFNTESFKPNAEARASVRAELGLPANALLIGRFGRNSAMKDYPTFIEAMRLVPNAHAIIAGTGTEDLKFEIRNSKSSKGITSFAEPDSNFEFRISVLGERHDLPRLTAALDIACSSSAFGEGFPNVVAEAMSSGVPCVVTDVGDSAWLLGTAGIVVPPNNTEVLAQALNELLALTPSERQALGEQGRQRILNDFSLPAVVAQFEAHLSAFHPSSFILHPSTPCVA